MANDLNRWQGIGRLTKNPEAAATNGGVPVSKFTMACNWKGKNSEGAEFVPIVVFDKLAEICNQWLKQGSKIFLEGRFTTRRWEDQNGQTRYMTEIKAENMQMLDSKGDNSGSGSAEYGGRQSAQKQPEPAQGEADLDSDIPFAPLRGLI